jgi:hypothetical protein
VWRRRGCCGVRRRPFCADWSDGFGSSIAGLQRPALSGYASRLTSSQGGRTSVMCGHDIRIRMGAVVGARTTITSSSPVPASPG